MTESKKFVAPAVLFLVLAIVVGVYFYTNKSKKVDETPVMQTPEEDLGFLQMSSTAKSPKVSKEVPLNADKLPTGVKFFLPKEGLVVSSSVTFDEKSKGYKASYQYQNSLVKTFDYLTTLPHLKNNFEFIEGHYKEGAGILFLENKEYTLEFDLLAKAEKLTEITIIATHK